MAEVSVTIHGKVYGIACDDGQERRVMELGKYVDARLREIAGSGAATNESHLLVLTALLLTDEIFDMKMVPQQAANTADVLDAEDEQIIVDAINHLATRIDTVADRLMKI